MDHRGPGPVMTIQPLPLRPDMRVGFVLLEHFTLHCVAELIEPIRFSADVSFQSRQVFCQWQWMTFDNQPVTSSCGLPVTPTAALDLEADWDYVVLAGGLLGTTTHPPEGLLQALQRLHARKIPVVALCRAVFVAAQSGLLNGRKCSVHFTTLESFRQRFPAVTPVVDRTWISDNGIISCPVGATRELAMAMILQHCGERRAKKVQSYLSGEAHARRPPARAARSAAVLKSPDSEMVQRAIHYMRQHLDSPETLQALAQTLRVTSRQLNQAFVLATGDTLAAYWRKLRLDHARALMTDTNSSLLAVARQCGFADASHLITWFRKQYGETPADYRKRRRSVDRLLHTDSEC